MNSDIFKSFNELLLSSDLERVKKLIVRYKIFEESLNVPGDIIECGVFKGTGIIYWLKLLKIFSPNSRKKVVGFDLFDAFNDDQAQEYEKKSIQEFVKEANFNGQDIEELTKIANLIDMSDRFELVKGDIVSTSKDYVKNNRGFKISLLHLDLDTYNATKSALENFFQFVSKGGIILIDEYGERGWGESEAVDEFFRDKDVQIISVPNSSKPTAYIKKINF